MPVIGFADSARRVWVIAFAWSALHEGETRVMESEIISKIRRRARPSSNVALGIGDDAAVIEHDGATDLLACSDVSVEGVHFRLDWTTPRLAGRKALAVTLSDVAAMGGKARFALISLAVPHSADASLADEVMQGVFDVADESEVAVIGGDTSSSPSGLFIDTVAIGECAQGAAIRRSGARAGDLICVTGALGASRLGLLLLERGYRLKAIEEKSSGDEALIQEAIRKHLQPEPRLAFGRAIGERRLATAMIDISDGLSTDLWHILEESHRGAVLYAEHLPIARCANELSSQAFGFDPLHCALHGGEEYELLFTVPEENQKEVTELAAALDLKVSAIGRITEGEGLMLEHQGRRERLAPSGYEHQI